MVKGERWLVLSDGARPTEDIYFLASAAPRLRSEGHEVGRLDVRGWRWPLARWVLTRQLGANLVLCRTLPTVALRWLERERARFGRILYLIDDELGAAAEDATLPSAYRARMASAAAQQPRLLALADEVVASSEALAGRLARRHARVAVLTPPLLAPLPDLAHLERGPTSYAPWRIGFHGTRAHLADLAHLAPALARVQSERVDSELELMLGEHVPLALTDLPRTCCPAPLPWGKFRVYQARRRVHIGLAPLLDTPFNRGKSFIKFLDIAAMGGVGIYSRRPPYTEIVEDGVNGLLADDDPRHWQRCLSWLLEHPGEARRMAANAAVTARRVGDPQAAAAFWRRRGGSIGQPVSGHQKT
ncbi:glycosyltransferase family protein [Halomonas nitroreducens]|uniref:Glycosyltransferase family 1 protein n=1 Tax=Halomonas nitroreducens TaxID=447425 RepID=A0A431V498_9GAMM|nr:glycosyltransferase [Halomonas nitroreducens]RTR05130.1 glycosyltransferase family 1 protein [Halomonas nitroreducens]